MNKSTIYQEVFEREYKNWCQLMQYIMNNKTYNQMDYEMQRDIRVHIKFEIFNKLKIRNMKFLKDKDIELAKNIADEILLSTEV